MKINIEFGGRGRHTMAAQNRALNAAVEALAIALEEERKAHAETREMYVQALQDRVSRGHRMRQGLRVVHGGEARFQLEN